MINIFKNIIVKFINTRFRFDLPETKKIIQYDHVNSDILKKVLKKDINIISRRNLEVYFWILLKQIFFFDFRFSTYLKNYIRFTSAKIVITLIDNGLIYYTFKNKINDVYFISIQNGTRASISFPNKNFLPYKNLECDYLFTLNKYIIKEYKKIIKSNYKVLGAFKSNYIKVNKTKFKKSYLFIADSNLARMRIGNSHKLYGYLSKYFSESNKKIHILIKGKTYIDQINEIKFFKKFFNKSICVFHKSKKPENSYKILDKFENLIFTNSTLGYEAIALKKKVAVFSVNKNKIQRNLFGWPKKDQKKYNFFSAKKLNYREVKRVLDNVNHCSQKNWEKEYYRYIRDLMYFDKDNYELKKVVDDILKISN